MKRISLLPLFFCVFLFLFIPIRIIQFFSLLVICFYLFSYGLSRYMFHSLAVTRDREVSYCPNGSVESLDFTIENRGFLPLENALIWDRATGCYGEGTGVFLDNFPGRGSRTYSCRILTGRRGKYIAGPIVVRGSDPFHFFPWKREFPLYSSIVVYPAGYPLDLILIEGERSGSVKTGKLQYEDLTDLKGIREYRPGDSLKRINWKASARTGTLQTMEFARNLNAPLLVLLDLTVSCYPLKHRHILLERAIEAAASLIISYGESGQSVSLLARGTDREIFIPSRRGYGHIISILEELAQAGFSDEKEEGSVIASLYERGVKPVSGTHVSLLLPLSDDRLFSEMELLYRRKCQLQIIATGGIQFPRIPSYCRQYTLSEYGKEYFDG